MPQAVSRQGDHPPRRGVGGGGDRPPRGLEEDGGAGLPRDERARGVRRPGGGFPLLGHRHRGDDPDEPFGARRAAPQRRRRPLHHGLRLGGAEAQVPPRLRLRRHHHRHRHDRAQHRERPGRDEDHGRGERATRSSSTARRPSSATGSTATSWCSPPAIPSTENPHAAVDLFLVEAGTPGFEKGKRIKKVGWHSQDTAELYFTDCRIPKANRLGDKGNGLPEAHAASSSRSGSSARSARWRRPNTCSRSRSSTARSGPPSAGP